MNDKTFLIFRGIPGSGKTTRAIQMQQENPRIIRVNRDELRRTMFGIWFGETVNEDAITTVQHAALEAGFKTGRPVISDATNLKARDARVQAELAIRHGYHVIPVDFYVDLNDALVRNGSREKSVPPKVVADFYRRFTPQGKMPPFPALTTEVVRGYTPYVEQDDLPWAVLVDIDGTLAHHEDVRGPYDTSRYHLDKPDYAVAGIAERYSSGDGKVFVMSGRDADYRDVTERWLFDKLAWKKGGIYEDLFMRPSGDRRNDSVVKDELFEKHIAGKYNVLFVLDDRDRVVNMWRAKGIKCLQVAPGAF